MVYESLQVRVLSTGEDLGPAFSPVRWRGVTLDCEPQVHCLNHDTLKP